MADLHLASTTRWHDIVAAQNNPALMAACLSGMAEKYHPLIQRFFRTTLRIDNPEIAADLTQSFFLHLLESNALMRLDRERGRLRTWLAASALNFLRDEKRRAKRGNHASPFLTFPPLPDHDIPDNVSLTPGEELHRGWAQQVVHDARIALRRYCEGNGRLHHYRVFERHVLGDGTEPRPTYEETAAELGISAKDVSNYRARMIEKFTHFLRVETRSLVGTGVDVEDELRILSRLLRPRQDSGG
ncbi:MAG: hypothetical protein LIQ31_13730 [Planctomycetes bacterium]|nr:hypothetical protein [Planctomycetota bacterium]